MTPAHDWIERAINRYIAGEERPFLLALVLGERGELTDEMKDEFRQSGIIHLISVSGLHTALVAMIAFVFLKGIRLPIRAALVGSTLIVWFYCGISGCSPPTLRSSIMVTCVVGSRVLGRSGGLASPLCASCAILLLVDPRYLRDVGFELSYAATGSMVAGRALGRIVRHFLSPPEWLSKYVISTILTTVIAQLGVLPILALQFGSVSAVSIPANLFAIPVASGALVSSFCSLGFLCLLPSLAACSFSLTWLLLRLCSLIAKSASSLPGASIELMKPTTWEVIIFMSCLFLVLTKLDSAFPPSEGSRAPAGAHINRRSKFVLIMAAFGTVLCVFRLAGGEIPWTRSSPNATEIIFLDVGQGDATSIKLQDGRLILIDGGECVDKWDSAKRVLIPFLREGRKKAFDTAFVTHFHSDHVNGVMQLLGEGRVKRLVLSNADTTSSLSRITRRLAREKRVSMYFVAAPCAPVSGPGIRLAVLNPSGFNTADTSFSSINDSSMVLILETKDVQFILTGDSGPQAMDRIADLLSPGKMTVLKAPHHGGKGTLSVRFLEKIRPRYVLFSVGRNNRFAHPARDVVDAYEKAGATTFRTDLDGSVSFRITEDSVSVTTARPASGLPLLEKAKSRRGERKIMLFALFSGSVSPRDLSQALLSRLLLLRVFPKP